MLLSKKTKHIIIVSLNENLEKPSARGCFHKKIKTKRQIIINFTCGLIMELLHTWH